MSSFLTLGLLLVSLFVNRSLSHPKDIEDACKEIMGVTEDMEHVICIDWERIPKLTDDDEPPKALSPYCSCIILGNRIEEYIKNRTKTEETLSKPDIQPEVTQKEVVEPTPVQTESYFLDIERYEKTYREISNMCETHKIHWNARDRGISNLSREYGRRLFNVVECIDKFLVELGYSALVQ